MAVEPTDSKAPVSEILGLHPEDFKEVAHCGGKVGFKIVTAEDKRRSYQVSFSHARAGPAALFGVYAIPQGVAVGPIHMGGIGQPWNPPPIAGCFPVLIGSDSSKMFGAQCPLCGQYWRFRHRPRFCAYCGECGERHEFLTEAQRAYVYHYCMFLQDALEQEEDGEHIIDMDAVADAIADDVEKPTFFYAEQSQQNKYTCRECGEHNDILGKFGYCSSCGTRNDLQEFEGGALAPIRTRIEDGGPYEACVKEIVAAFDTLAGHLVRQLSQRIPMTQRRRRKLESMRFHNLDVVESEVRKVFDIDLLKGLSSDDAQFISRMFHRRHVYEHLGGEADQKYIDNSGDITVRVKQTLKESRESAHRAATLTHKLSRNLHLGFHSIFSPDMAWIEEYSKRK